VVEDGQDLDRPFVRRDRVRRHRGELGGLTLANQDGSLAELESDRAAQHGEPLVARMHLRRRPLTLLRDAHLGDRDAAAVALSREEPDGGPRTCLGLGANHDVVVALWLDEAVDGRAESLGDRYQLIERDAAVPRLDATQGGGGKEAAGGHGVESPSPGEPEAAHALANDVFD
jgi:hypothetical protein